MYGYCSRVRDGPCSLRKKTSSGETLFLIFLVFLNITFANSLRLSHNAFWSYWPSLFPYPPSPPSPPYPPNFEFFFLAVQSSLCCPTALGSRTCPGVWFTYQGLHHSLMTLSFLFFYCYCFDSLSMCLICVCVYLYIHVSMHMAQCAYGNHRTILVFVLLCLRQDLLVN